MSRSKQQPEFRRVIADRKALLGFGKFAKESVQDILDNSPDYILWLDANTNIDIACDILTEAQDNMHPDHEFKGFTERSR